MKIQAVNALNKYENSNYSLDQGSKSFIVFGTQENDKSILNFNKIKQKSPGFKEAMKVRRKSSLERNEIINAIIEKSSWFEIDDYFVQIEDSIQENLFISSIEQEISIRALNDLISVSEERPLTNEEALTVKKYILILDKNNFPDIVFISKAMQTSSKAFSSKDMNKIISNLKINARKALSNCEDCFQKRERNEFERQRDLYFNSMKESLKIIN